MEVRVDNFDAFKAMIAKLNINQSDVTVVSASDMKELVTETIETTKFNKPDFFTSQQSTKIKPK